MLFRHKEKTYPLIFTLLNSEEKRRMNTKRLLLMSVLATLLTISVCNPPFKAMASNSRTIKVPQDYGTIQDAINNANQGDTVYVSSGNYDGSITLNRTGLKVIGESRSNTIINLNEGTSVKITSESTLIQGFSIRNATNSEYLLRIESDDAVVSDNIFDSNNGGIYCGFLLGDAKVRNNLIIGNEFRNNVLCSIYLSYACENVISNNSFSNDNWAITLYEGSNDNVIDGNTILNMRTICINLSNSSHNSVSNNYLNSAGTTGIYVDANSNYNDIRGNVVANINGIWGIIYVINSFYNNIANNVLFNNSAGIYLDHASHEILSNNDMEGNRYGIGVNGAVLSHFVHSIDNSNKIDGKPVCYIVSQNEMTIDSTMYPEVGFLGIVNSTDVKIEGLRIADNWQGLLLAYTTNSTVENVTVSNNFSGIDLMNSSNDTLVCNTISNNAYGIRLNSESKIYKNNFVNNSQQVQCSIQNSSWDNGAEGNFWDDYAGEDKDKNGIGDFPYVVNMNNQDNYPLINPASPQRVFRAGTWNQIPYYVTVYSNCTIGGFDFNESFRRISFNVTGPSGKAGFCNVSIPMNLLDGSYEIWIDNATTSFSLVSNGTHNFLYFICNCSTRNVKVTGTTVISEFIMLPVFSASMLLTLTITLAKKLKKKCRLVL